MEFQELEAAYRKLPNAKNYTIRWFSATGEYFVCLGFDGPVYEPTASGKTMAEAFARALKEAKSGSLPDS